MNFSSPAHLLLNSAMNLNGDTFSTSETYDHSDSADYKPLSPPSSVQSSPYQAAKASNSSLYDLNTLIDTKMEGKPPYSYAKLIIYAIITSKNQALTLNEIYNWILENFPYYRTTGPGWKNSIRHNLSLNKTFVRVPRAINEPGKGSYWTVNLGAANGKSKRIKERKEHLPYYKELQYDDINRYMHQTIEQACPNPRHYPPTIYSANLITPSFTSNLVDTGHFLNDNSHVEQYQRCYHSPSQLLYSTPHSVSGSSDNPDILLLSPTVSHSMYSCQEFPFQLESKNSSKGVDCQFDPTCVKSTLSNAFLTTYTECPLQTNRTCLMPPTAMSLPYQSFAPSVTLAPPGLMISSEYPPTKPDYL